MASDLPGSWPLWVRAATLVLAGAPCLALLIHPWLIGRELSVIDRILLPVVLAAAGGGIAFGLGFAFPSRILRTLTMPPVLWPVLIAGFALLWIY